MAKYVEFDALELVKSMVARKVKTEIATSVRVELWLMAEIYPTPRNRQLVFSDREKELLAFFG